MKRIILLVSIAWFYTIHGISEEPGTGVSFNSGAEPIDHCTSLSLFEENPEKFEDSFAIGFDLSIGDTKQFGYVLRVIDDENNEFEGTDVHDDKGRIYGQIKNPSWLINLHFRWKKNIAFYSECTAGVAYDDVLNRIFVLNSGEAIYNKEQDKCYLYNLDQSDPLASSMAADENVMNKLPDIQRHGALLPNLQEEWVDSYKRSYENRLEKIFGEYIHTLYAGKKYAQLIDFSEVYFIIDPLNEEVLDLCLKAFRKIGKSEQGQALSNKFAANYKISMGENWKKEKSTC